MRRIIFCKTYYQVILAIQLKSTMFFDDEVDLIISDHSNGMEKVYKKIIKYNIFEHVVYVEYAEREKSSITNGVVSGIKLGFKLYKTELTGIYKDIKVDELISYNVDQMIYSLCDTLKKNNSDLVVSKMEEGIFSYREMEKSTYNRRIRLATKIRHILKSKDIFTLREKFYVFFPELVDKNNNYNVIPVKRIEINEKWTEMLNYIFSVDVLDLQKEYDRKYVFLGSILKNDGEDIGEEKLVEQVSNKIGKENIIIKQHPRDSSEFYMRKGYKVAKTSNVPWEIILMNLVCRDKVFITTLSGSILATSVLACNKGKSILLFKLLGNNDSEYVNQQISFISRQIKILNEKYQGKYVVVNDLVDILD